MTFKLALAQMRVEGGRKSANLRRAADRIAAAAAAGAQVVLLPEALSLGWMHPSAATEADEVPGGESCAALRAAARAHGVFVCAGLVERDGARVFNSAVLIAPGGEVLLHHRKINELEMAHTCYALGDRLAVAHTPLGAIGVMICADGFAPGQAIGRTLGLMGAQVILSPCAWAMPPDHDNTARPYGWLWRENWGPVARDFRLWIAGASNVGRIDHGPWTGYPCIGNSLCLDPNGADAVQGPYGADAEALLFANITPLPRPVR